MQFWILVIPMHRTGNRLHWPMQNFWICPRSCFCATWLCERWRPIWFHHHHISGKAVFSDVTKWGKPAFLQQSWSVDVFAVSPLYSFGCQPGSFSERVVSMLAKGHFSPSLLWCCFPCSTHAHPSPGEGRARPSWWEPRGDQRRGRQRRTTLSHRTYTMVCVTNTQERSPKGSVLICRDHVARPNSDKRSDHLTLKVPAWR